MKWLIELRGGRPARRRRIYLVEHLGAQLERPIALRSGIYIEHYRLELTRINGYLLGIYDGLSRSDSLYQCRNVRTKP